MDEKVMKVLDEIRDAVQDNSKRIDQTNARLDQTNAHLNQLDDRVTGMDVRLGTQLMEVSRTLNTVKQLFADRLELRDRVERCESDIEELKRRP